MDMIERKRLWFEDEKRAQGEAFIRHLEHKAARRRFFAFCFNWRQVVDDPGTAVPTPDSVPSATSARRVSASGVGSGAAGFRDVTSTNALTPLASGSRLPGGPTHLYCSEASRISAANRHT